MNDQQMRSAFHATGLRKHHLDPATLVLDELGLEHGDVRADIVVINGRMEGYEIKSDGDSLSRLTRQIEGYDAVFDRSSVITTPRHEDAVARIIPRHWGIITTTKATNGNVIFRSLRAARQNEHIDDLAVARLLWRRELIEILEGRGIRRGELLAPRAVLYQRLVSLLESKRLRRVVRDYLRRRKNWRALELPVPSGD